MRVWLLTLTLACATTARADSVSDTQPQVASAITSSVERCWNTGNLSPEALHVSIAVIAHIDAKTRVDPASIRLLSYEYGSDEAAGEAYKAARRAILRCGHQGLLRQHDGWVAQDVTLVFSGTP